MSRKKTITRLEKEAASGNLNAQFYLSVIYEDGRGVKADAVKAANWCMMAAEAGDRQSQFRLAKMIEEGRGFVKKDERTAWYWLKRSASQGYTNAQYELGLRHLFGLSGVQKSLHLAKRWLAVAAHNGHPEAAYYLAFMYMNGLGFVQDASQAFTHFSLAANLGSVKAKCSLAFLYEQGKGCQKDLVKAQMLYEQAASGGHIGAQFGLACLHISLEQYKDALIWLGIAANNGITQAQAILAKFYMEGTHIKHDFVKALMWCMVIQNTEDADEDSIELASACHLCLRAMATQNDIDQAYMEASKWLERRRELPLMPDTDWNSRLQKELARYEKQKKRWV